MTTDLRIIFRILLKSTLFALVGFALIILVQRVVLHRVSDSRKVEEHIVDLNYRERILVLAPHPDDEIIGCGGIIQKAKAMGLPVKVVFFTYGDTNEWAFMYYRKHPVLMPKAVMKMGQIRHDEAMAATQFLGIDKEDVVFLGYPDFGTFNLWLKHWGDALPYRSLLTQTKVVPYSNAFRPGAEYKGEEIIKDLESLLRDFRPTKIFVSHPADTNGDHRSLYLFLKVALLNLEKEMVPQVYPYLVHFKKFPKPYGHQPELLLDPPLALEKEINWHDVMLSAREVEVKESALKRHVSQYKSTPKYLSSFIRANELFGDFPSIELYPKSKITVDEEASSDVPEELTDEERAAFIGMEKRTMAIEDNDLVLTINLTRPLGRAVGVSLYVFGYRADKNFALMPKIHIRIGTVVHDVYDQRKRVESKEVKVIRKSKQITVRIPLDLLGEPEHVLTSAQTFLARVPLDAVAWRILDLQK